VVFYRLGGRLGGALGDKKSVYRQDLYYL